MAFLIMLFIVATGIIGLAWAWYNYNVLSKMEVEDISRID